MIDLIYAPKKVFDEIKKEFPTAKYTDARDDIHLQRFEIEISELKDCFDDKYLRLGLKLGFILDSLPFQIRIMSEQKFVKKINAMFEEMKKNGEIK